MWDETRASQTCGDPLATPLGQNINLPEQDAQLQNISTTWHVESHRICLAQSSCWSAVCKFDMGLIFCILASPAVAVATATAACITGCCKVRQSQFHDFVEKAPEAPLTCPFPIFFILFIPFFLTLNVRMIASILVILFVFFPLYVVNFNYLMIFLYELNVPSILEWTCTLSRDTERPRLWTYFGAVGRSPETWRRFQWPSLIFSPYFPSNAMLHIPSNIIHMLEHFFAQLIAVFVSLKDRGDDCFGGCTGNSNFHPPWVFQSMGFRRPLTTETTCGLGCSNRRAQCVGILPPWKLPDVLRNQKGSLGNLIWAWSSATC